MGSKMILEHMETKERKEMTNAEFIIFMREHSDRGLWVVAETEYTNMAGEHLRAALSKIEALENDLRLTKSVNDSTYYRIICAIVGSEVHPPIVSSKGGGEEYKVSPHSILNESLNAMKYAKSFADAIKLTLDRHQIAWEKSSYDYDEEDY